MFDVFYETQRIIWSRT